MKTFGGYVYLANNKTNVAIIGAPCDLGVTGVGGQRAAPESIRLASGEFDVDTNDPFSRSFDYATRDVADFGDIEIVSGDYEASIDVIADNMTKMLKKCKRFVVMGGDDGINRGVLEAVANARDVPGVILLHYDAHADYYAPATPGRSDHGTWIADVIRAGYVDEVHQFGIRAFGPSPQHLKRIGIGGKVFYTGCNGGQVTDLEAIRAKYPTHYLHLAIDIDAIDPAFAPATAFPEPGGYTSREIRWIVRSCASFIDSMSITEVLPAYDSLGLTAQLASRIIFDYIFGSMVG